MQNIFPTDKTPMQVLQMIHNDIKPPSEFNNIFKILTGENVTLDESAGKPTVQPKNTTRPIKATKAAKQKKQDK
jgi:hypothetical protein